MIVVSFCLMIPLVSSASQLLNSMNHQRAIDRELLIPILIGGFSVVGIIAVLLVGRSLNAPAEIAVTPSATPFQYVYLGTEPAITTLVVEGSELPPTEETIDEFVTPTRPSIATPIILTPPNGTRTSTPSRQPTVTRTNTPSAANTYDDTDTRLDYTESPGWVSQTGVNGAYQGTLHISNTVGNSVTFQFSGQEIHLFYDAGPSLGSVTIYIDNDTLGITINQALGGEWIHTLDTAGSHKIVITHTSGGSVNIDRLVIPAPTPTPTRTPTP
jgi:hypothetical protein